VPEKTICFAEDYDAILSSRLLPHSLHRPHLSSFFLTIGVLVFFSLLFFAYGIYDRKKYIVGIFKLRALCTEYRDVM
jgi:hypothetical protein